ncbi:hypothetical protein SAMN05443549_106108 [Flavobacterium fluvii]|uniref:YCII-related domain-containing protein n=1 Tax=Flavobacterium fluvii TaxID=468056 RepID=A0A1M5MBG8_9FLAO|nr:hypothetical protein [Flavobacterium fluvii]SHG74640.1 hypothetical protein SAMN05443549_106108 [Flavobacterium fluvii]
MKAVLIGESSGASMDEIMSVYPRHKIVVDEFIAKGVVLGIGPFSDRGNMAIFKTRKDAEDFAQADPFILEGLLKSFVIKDWGDSLLPE